MYRAERDLALHAFGTHVFFYAGAMSTHMLW